MARPVPAFLAALGTALVLSAGTAAVSAAAVSSGGLAVSSTSAPAPASSSQAPAPAKARASSTAVGAQRTWTGRTSPVDLPGTGIERGDRLPAGSVLVYRAVDVPRREKRRVRLVVPRGKAIVTAAQSGAFGSGVVNRDYVGTRSVTIRVGGGTAGAEGRLYAYAR